jgi:hypothetical protein
MIYISGKNQGLSRTLDDSHYIIVALNYFI